VANDPRDPRSIITPAAFQIDRGLLGLPLAAPWTRFWALLIDLAMVALLTALLSDVQLLVWSAIGLVLMRLAFKQTGKSVSQAAGLLLRTSAGCLGVAILAIVLIVWGLSRMGEEEREAALGEVIERGADLAPGVRAQIADMDLSDAETADEALEIMTGGARRLREVPPAVRRQLLRAAVPPEAPWAAAGDSLVELALARAEAGAAGAGTGVPDSTRAGVAQLTDDEVLTALAAERASASPDPERLAALTARAAAIVATDTLDELNDRVADLTEEVAEEREAREEMAQELGEQRSGVAAFAALLGDLWGQVGSAIGLWSLYFTVLLTVLKGQTIGKRIMRVRVLRLDGEPIGWWSAFERAGGYAAGLATGFLGFAQVFWDPNRQCIHDKIVGTVVVVDGAERLPWEAAWDKRTKS
jgi:uncharacterized RDD family membrane protein YckC